MAHHAHRFGGLQMSDIAILAKGFAIALPVIMTTMNMVPIARMEPSIRSVDN